MSGKTIFLFFFIFTTFSVHAQVSISGRIVNSTGTDPVSKASVYINNSTIGTASGENGEYILNGILPGVYEIVVSHIGFELLVFKVEVKFTDLKLTFRLDPKVKQMRDILILNSNLRSKWMKVLRENFLGLTIAADRTKILNEDEIFFENIPDRNVIKAFSELPLIIENKELGYRVYFELREFYFDALEGKTLFYGFSRYEEIGKPDTEPARKYLRNREKIYRGSTLHFYHSLLADKLAEEGYTTFITRQPDTLQAKKSNKPVDSVGTTKQQTDAPQLAFAATRKEIFYSDSSDNAKHYLNWTGTLRVRYKSDPYFKADLERKVFVSGNLPKGFQSGILMLEAPAYLDPNGILINPLAVQYSGFWSYEKLANMLPINYRPQ